MLIETCLEKQTDTDPLLEGDQEGNRWAIISLPKVYYLSYSGCTGPFAVPIRFLSSFPVPSENDDFSDPMTIFILLGEYDDLHADAALPSNVIRIICII